MIPLQLSTSTLGAVYCTSWWSSGRHNSLFCYSKDIISVDVDGAGSRAEGGATYDSEGGDKSFMYWGTDGDAEGGFKVDALGTTVIDIENDDDTRWIESFFGVGCTYHIRYKFVLENAWKFLYAS